MKFIFYCDESYDGSEPPHFFTISGILSNYQTWKELEPAWNEINSDFGVSRFHAQPLNRKEGEYSGWDDEKKKQYSAALLNVINCYGNKIVAYNCGMYVDEYLSIINETGQKKLGNPYLACFNSCVAMITRHMEEESDFQSDWHFDVIHDQGSKFDRQVHDYFNLLKSNPNFPYRHRMGNFTLAKSEDYAGLQTADLMAYEYFKRLMNEKKGEMRKPLSLLREHNHYEEGYFGRATFERYKHSIESAQCGPGQLVFIPDLKK